MAAPPATASTPATPAGTATGDAGPAPEAGQLVSFTRFASKDPFVQQIDPGATPDDSGGGAKPSSRPAKQAGGASGSGASSSSGGGSKPTATTTATLVVNGVREQVAVGGEFPKSAPFFQLVKVGPSSAQIGIAGGSYANGEQAETVRKGRDAGAPEHG